MDYLNEIASHYESVFNILGSIVGVLGFLFGMWRFFREQRAQKELAEKQRELDHALSRLKHLQNLASGLSHYSAAV
jgi:hypothetical protein